MKYACLVVGCCAVTAGQASADTFVVPHILDATGHITINNTPSPLHAPVQTNASVDVFGPDGDTGAFTYNYFDTVRWTGSDFQGRAFTLDFSVLFCQNRPEGGGFRFEMLASPTLVSLGGNPVNVSSELVDLTGFGAAAEPIGTGAGITMDVPAMHFSAEDDSGRTISMDMNAGTLRLIPSPVSAAVLAIAGLFKMRRHR